MWRITIALLALPIIAAITLAPSVETWNAWLTIIAILTTVLCWGLAALLLRYYGKWPWQPK